MEDTPVIKDAPVSEDTPVMKSLLKKLKDASIEVRRKTFLDKQYLIFTDTVVILLDENNKAILSFDVDVRPDFAAFLSIQLSKIRGIKDILIGELFMHDSKKQIILTGNEAVKEFTKVSKQTAVSEFIKEQMTEHILRSNMKIPSC
jgi:hypothetical protein